MCRAGRLPLADHVHRGSLGGIEQGLSQETLSALVGQIERGAQLGDRPRRIARLEQCLPEQRTAHGLGLPAVGRVRLVAFELDQGVGQLTPGQVQPRQTETRELVRFAAVESLVVGLSSVQVARAQRGAAHQ